MKTHTFSLDEAIELAADAGPAAESAMALLRRYAEVVGADRYVPIVSSHIDACLYHGPSSVTFVKSFCDLGGRVKVPTTLNVGAVDTLHPGFHQGSSHLLGAQEDLTTYYTRLGCSPTLTCAPYQRLARPRIGDQIAWAESNAIVFANSVLGARTERYGDFIDLCAALTGLAPYAGLHRDENRLADLVLIAEPWNTTGLPRDLYFACLGYRLGKEAQARVAVVENLPGNTSEDELKSMGAAAASSGAVALFHAVGITPEAPTLAAATRGQPDTLEHRRISSADLRASLDVLCPLAAGEPVAAACFGTPHFSLSEFRALASLLSQPSNRPVVEVYVSTSRAIASELEQAAWAEPLRSCGIKIVVDTCTYLAPVVQSGNGAIVTNSAKWAHYAPGNLKRRAGLMSLERCLRSAATGRVVEP